jgi:hypothetical protein
MATHFKLTANVTLLIGVQLIALWIASNTTPLANFSNYHFDASTTPLPVTFAADSQTLLDISFSAKSNQGYKPPNTIGGPTHTLGSGTR